MTISYLYDCYENALVSTNESAIWQTADFHFPLINIESKPCVLIFFIVLTDSNQQRETLR